MTKQDIRKAYLTLCQALHDKPIADTTTAKRYNSKAHYIRQLQDIAVYLNIIQ